LGVVFPDIPEDLITRKDFISRAGAFGWHDFGLCPPSWIDEEERDDSKATTTSNAIYELIHTDEREQLTLVSDTPRE